MLSSNLRSGIATLSSRANLDLAALWRSVDNAVRAREALNDVLPALVDQYGQAAATLAATWYDDLRVQQAIAGRFEAIPAELPGDAGTRALAGWGTSPLFSATPDVSAAQALIAGGLQRRIANMARDTITRSSVADPHARGWHREGSGECDWCSMLIGRGDVYSEATADFPSHDHCECQAAPSWS